MDVDYDDETLYALFVCAQEVMDVTAGIEDAAVAESAPSPDLLCYESLPASPEPLCSGTDSVEPEPEPEPAPARLFFGGVAVQSARGVGGQLVDVRRGWLRRFVEWVPVKTPGRYRLERETGADVVMVGRLVVSGHGGSARGIVLSDDVLRGRYLYRLYVCGLRVVVEAATFNGLVWTHRQTGASGWCREYVTFLGEPNGDLSSAEMYAGVVELWLGLSEVVRGGAIGELDGLVGAYLMRVQPAVSVESRVRFVWSAR